MTSRSAEGMALQDEMNSNQPLYLPATRCRPLTSALVLLFAATSFLNLQALPATGHSFTGEVSDAMCGRKHMEGESAAECTRACVAHGSKYALLVGDKLYTLETSDKAALATLDKQAGQSVSVTGSLNEAGDTIEVKSVLAK
jgi:hypothetical protein